MNNGSGHDDLLRQMAAARAALSRDAQSAVANARTLADWKHHFRAHPWLFCGGAAALGFLLVPQRKPSGGSTADERATGDAAEVPASIAATVLGAAATFAARQSLNYLIRRGFDLLEQRSPPAGETTSAPDVDSARP
ncbi:MAG: hypothetical protein WD845_06765 [Pirellulales bacterium]